MTQPKANEYQVGGDHYKSNYQHWDFVIYSGLNYLEAQATRYLQRWDKKGDPLNDLKKAKHYVEKLIGSAYIIKDTRRRPNWVDTETDLFCLANNLHKATAEAIRRVVMWSVPVDLNAAIEIIDNLIYDLDVEDMKGRTKAKPVPAEDKPATNPVHSLSHLSRGYTNED